MTDRQATRRLGAITASGWYRVTERGWEPVPDADAEREISGGAGWDLVHVRRGAEEVTLW